MAGEPVGPGVQWRVTVETVSYNNEKDSCYVLFKDSSGSNHALNFDDPAAVMFSALRQRIGKDLALTLQAYE